MRHRLRLLATAVVLAAAGLCAAEPQGPSPGAAASAAEWPCFRGPNGNGVVPDWPGGLIDDPRQAKVLWVGEEKNLPLGWGFGEGPSNKNRCAARSGGYAGAVAVGGRMFFQYYVPSGECVDEKVASAEKGQDKRKESWTVDADDVLLCLDANTGKKLWKAVFSQKGFNWNLHRGNPYLHPCVVGDRVYLMGCGGRVNCLQAQDGKTLWESDTGKGSAAYEKARQTARAARTVEFAKAMPWCSHGDSGASTPFLASLALADGVVVCDDGYREGKEAGFGLVGLDAQSGKLLWRVPNAVGSGVSPNRWVHGGREYVLAMSARRVICVEPKTGNVLWEFADDSLIQKSTPAASGEFMLAQGKAPPHGPDAIRKSKQDPEPDKNRGLTGFRITPQGCTRLWALKWPEYQAAWSPPLIHGAYGYALCGGGLVCIEMETGKVAATVKAGDNKMPLWACNGVLFAGLDLVKLDPKDFRVLGKFRVSKELYTPIAISEGRMFVRGRMEGYARTANPPEPDCFYCLDLRRK
jgi:hypothetical protein